MVSEPERDRRCGHRRQRDVQPQRGPDRPGQPGDPARPEELWRGLEQISTSVKDTLIYNVPIHQNAEFVEGIQGSAFVFDLGTLCIAHLGDLSQKLNEQQIKAFGKVDVALTPIGGGRTMGPDLAKEVLAQLKPKIAIPMHIATVPI